ncbi:hypothetical protein C7D73_30665, partial [Klebsiella pneumoniae]
AGRLMVLEREGKAQNLNGYWTAGWKYRARSGNQQAHSAGYQVAGRLMVLEREGKAQNLNGYWTAGWKYRARSGN